MSEDRWDLLQKDIIAAGVECHLTRYQPPGTLPTGIWIHVPGAGLVCVENVWFSNDDRYNAWSVHAEGRGGIVIKDYPTTKERSVVVANVLDALKVFP